MIQCWLALCFLFVGPVLERDSSFSPPELFSPFVAQASIVNIVKKVQPAVVNVSIQAAPAGAAQESVGSGFVISSQGFLLTNTHVVSKTGTIVVRFANNDSYSATLVVADKKTDVALLRIEPGKPLPFIPLGVPESIGGYVRCDMASVNCKLGRQKGRGTRRGSPQIE
ncbi:MAG TPA: trypsin-like peptidase domain-containing protein [Acidobacteriota bacterium]|nr:trypsin-like peptidase domain-containing protein [Acidobacteriota bacterium]